VDYQPYLERADDLGLEASGFVRSYVPPGRKEKGKLYQLVDCFSLFHLNFMGARRQDDDMVWLTALEGGRHHAWSGYAFEMVCLWHVPQIKAAFAAETKTRHALHLTMVTVQGLVRNAYANDIQSEVAGDDLFRG
jgi:hypothetical protein